MTGTSNRDPRSGSGSGSPRPAENLTPPDAPDLPQSGLPQPGSSPTSPLLRLPGMAAIALYMLFLAGVVILGVAGKRYPPLYLAFPVLFLAAGFGLLLFLRWAWALALAAVVMLMTVFFFEFVKAHAAPGLVQSLLNLVFFLYLVRGEVRDNLR
jgi:hypothetical protein